MPRREAGSICSFKRIFNQEILKEGKKLLSQGDGEVKLIAKTL
jgi:hypothetical protein